jgi:Uma2 family endonuclease
MNASLAGSGALTTPHPARLTVGDFLLLSSSGAFDRYAKTELINGAVTVVNAQFSEHLTAKIDLLLLLNEACNRLGTGMRVWSEGSVALAEDSMPEPDLFITTVRPTTGAVRPETIVLIVEVADTSLRTDLGEKAILYAVHGIAEYWVLDLPGRAIHQLWRPQANGYSERRVVKLGERVEAVTIAGLGVSTEELA